MLNPITGNKNMKTHRREFIRRTGGLLAASGALVSGMYRASAAVTPSFAQFEITRRYRRRMPGSPGAEFVEVHEDVRLDVERTALILCDVWDLHHCLNAVTRVGELAPHIDSLTRYLRAQGVTIIHAPSSCMPFYEGNPARERAMAAPRASNVPQDIGQWCHWMPGGEEEKNYPIDQSDGGCDSDPVEQSVWRRKLIDMGKNPDAPWTRQVGQIFIDSTRDYITDDGVEVWNIMEMKGLTNVLLTGVHTNMCVLGRPFGLRQMARNGKNVHLIRDLTDTMYNPQSAPYVSHFEGTRRIIHHIEKYVCPTVLSSEFVGGEPFRFKGETA